MNEDKEVMSEAEIVLKYESTKNLALSLGFELAVSHSFNIVIRRDEANLLLPLKSLDAVDGFLLGFNHALTERADVKRAKRDPK